jgi:high affinity sulfate transporter 1
VTTSNSERSGLASLIPALSWLPGYDRSWLGPDLIAGVTAAAVVVPQAMGYATVAGLPPEVGLYTCIFPMAVYAFLGTSRRLSFSTTSTIVALTGLGLVTAGATGEGAVPAVATLTLMVGAALILFRFLNLGWLLESVSEAVVAGLKLAVGLTIIADQLPKLLGIAPADGGFIPDVRNAVEGLSSANTATLILSLVTLAGLFALKRWAPRVPGPLLAAVGGILLVILTNITERGVELIPEVPTGLPLPAIPSLDLVGPLLPFALAIAFMSYFETVTAARIARDPDDPPVDNNQEYVADGAATLVGAFFQTVPPAGGFSQTQVNTNAGAQTQVSQLVTVLVAIVIALFLAPVLSDLPAATLGAIVVVSVSGLLVLTEVRRIRQIDPVELVVVALTALFALVFDLLIGVLVGVFLTFYMVLRRLNRPAIVELRRPPTGGEPLPAREGDGAIPGMLILRIEGGLYTLNVRRAQEEIYARVDGAEPRPEVLLLDVGATVDTSVTVIDIMAETERQLARHGTQMWLAAIPERAEAKARRTDLWDEWLDAGRIHSTVSAAVEAFEMAKKNR